MGPIVVLSETYEQIPRGGATGNVINFCSWTRLVEELRESGAIQPNEEVVCFELSARGINIRMVTR
jgi:hypothetical protein